MPVKDGIGTYRGRLIWLVVLIIGLACCHKREHGVTLTWTPSPSTSTSTVVGYNVYRRTREGPRIKIATLVPHPPYEDRLVVSGQTYFYVVRAVDQLGRESGASAETTATIP
jgi:hypothetical protein